jgi:phosphatidylserine/phosphatidylglycerophosphate/cardiolipin synthase-like enzyme
MAMKLRVFVNEDDALLFWSIPEPIDECRGFAIERRRNDEEPEFLHNRTGFESEDDHTESVTSGDSTRPSTEWPFQRFSWTDHNANTGDTVSYRVVPVIREDGTLRTLDSEASEWSEPKTLGQTKGKFKPFFNRGFVMSQFMSRFLKAKKLTLEQFKDRIRDRDDKTIREFLAGDLRLELLRQLQIAKEEKGEVYAVLFELSDDELIDALAKLGKRAHVVLANGSVQAAKGEPSKEARKRDENKEARKLLIKKKVDVVPKHRFLSPGALGHNKFLVRTDANGRAKVAWTGSTNWAPTGLCTQVNNGLLIEDTKVAKIYLEQFHRLRDALSAFSDELLDSNTEPKHTGVDTPGSVRSTVWFTRTRGGADMDALREEVVKAKEGVLFLMFMPGSAGLFSTVAALSANPKLYVRGVVSELPNGRGDESAVDVNLIDNTTHRSLHLDIIQPEGVKHPFANFAAEVTHKDFNARIGHAIIHSKVVVMDPFSDDPTVITGSHNFSSSASSKNDENFIIVKGDRALAEAYAVNIIGAYAHYRWRAYLQKTNRPFNGLKDNDRWQKNVLAGARRELRFFGV